MSCEVRVTVRCDRCGVEGRHTRLGPSVRLAVWEELLQRVTHYLGGDAWCLRKSDDLCPTCENKRQLHKDGTISCKYGGIG